MYTLHTVIWPAIVYTLHTVIKPWMKYILDSSAKTQESLSSGADPGGGGPGGLGPPFQQKIGIDFYSGFRKKMQVYTFIVAS